MMKAWLYYRLSRDEDEEMNSLQNQRQILIDYAEQNGYEIVGESFDDNVSGMTFNRKGLGELEIAVDEGKIDVVLVKDLSRLGRHRTQTELFIDHLRQNNVKVYSVTEGIDSTNENDDLAKREEEIASLEKKISELREYDKVCKQRKEHLKNTTQILNEILSEGKISDVNLRMLVNKILIHQNEDKSLDIEFEMKGDFNNTSSMPITLKSQLESA